MVKQLQDSLAIASQQRRTEAIQKRQHRDSVVFGVIYTLQLIPSTVNPVPRNRSNILRAERRNDAPGGAPVRVSRAYQDLWLMLLLRA
jgi:hypothetical protein